MAEQSTNHSARPLDEQSLIRKLNLRDGHSLLPWLTAELRDRFDYRCCDNEARFLRIKDLIVDLRNDDKRRWREKVTDVRRWFDFVAAVIDRSTLETVSVYQDSSGQYGGEKAKLAFTILVAAIAYQYDLEPEHPVSDRFHFVVVDEMFSKVDDQHAEYALELFQQFGLQLLIVAPLDAKARVTQSYVGCYLHVVKKDNRSSIYEMTATEFDEIAEADSRAGETYT